MLVALYYVTAALFVLIVLGGVMWLAGFSLFKFLKYLRDELSSRRDLMRAVIERLRSLRRWDLPAATRI